MGILNLFLKKRKSYLHMVSLYAYFINIPILVLIKVEGLDTIRFSSRPLAQHKLSTNSE